MPKRVPQNSLQPGKDLVSTGDGDLAGFAVNLGVDDLAILVEDHSPAAAVFCQ